MSALAASLVDVNQMTKMIIGCAIEVHRNLGLGLLESTYYEEALRSNWSRLALG